MNWMGIGLVRGHTGGCSSFSLAPARSGLAVKFEKTPSLWMPLPKILFDAAVTAAAAAVAIFDLAGAGAGMLLAAEPPPAVELPLMMGSEFCLTRRCLSSGSSSSSESSASNASARVGSLTRLFRGVGEDALEWKDGGGELGICWRERVVWMGEETWSSSSWALTCWLIRRDRVSLWYNL